MVSSLLIVQGTTALVTGLVYAYVARLVYRRPTSDEARRANLAFATWWAAFGALEFFASAYTFPAAFGYRDLALAVTLIVVIFVLVAVAIGGLLFFLVYLYTGSRRAFWPIVAAYAVLALALIYLVAWMQPIGFDESKGAGQIAFTRQLVGAPAIAFGLLLSVPVILAALGYGSLFFRTRLPEARFRIALVALSFLLWFGWSAVSTVLQLATRHPGSVVLLGVNSVITLAAALAVVVAYQPPALIRARF